MIRGWGAICHGYNYLSLEAYLTAAASLLALVAFQCLTCDESFVCLVSFI